MTDTRLTDDGFYWMRDNVLTKEFCQNIIHKFDSCPHKAPGVTSNGYNPEIKRSTDLPISQDPLFVKEDEVIKSVLTPSLQAYFQQMAHCPWDGPFYDTGYNLQKTTPGEYYTWHTDFHLDHDRKGIRILTFIFYLNDVCEKGGQTEFCNGVTVQPKTGRLMVFPSDLSVYHRGVSPVTTTKYILTGWLYQPMSSL